MLLIEPVEAAYKALDSTGLCSNATASTARLVASMYPQPRPRFLFEFNQEERKGARLPLLGSCPSQRFFEEVVIWRECIANT